jgi:hypothetical protein
LAFSGKNRNSKNWFSQPVFSAAFGLFYIKMDEQTPVHAGLVAGIVIFAAIIAVVFARCVLHSLCSDRKQKRRISSSPSSRITLPLSPRKARITPPSSKAGGVILKPTTNNIDYSDFDFMSQV